MWLDDKTADGDQITIDIDPIRTVARVEPLSPSALYDKAQDEAGSFLAKTTPGELYQHAMLHAGAYVKTDGGPFRECPRCGADIEPPT